MSQLLLQVRGGRMADEKFVVPVGGGCTVGRTALADVVLPHDEHLSSVHFTVEARGDVVRIIDRQSRAGTWVDGRRVVGEALAGDGAFVRAGTSSFSLVHAASPRVAIAPTPGSVVAASKHLSYLLSTAGVHLHAIVDGARTSRGIDLARRALDPMKSLYEGLDGDAMAEASPYLIRFLPGSPLLERLVEETWGRSCTVFVVSRATFVAVRRHLRRLLIAEVEGFAAPSYFRFYDPRVLRALAPTWSPRQRNELFDIVDAYLFEGSSGEIIVHPGVEAS